MIKCHKCPSEIPQADVPYIKLEFDKEFKYTCIKCMTEPEQFERFADIMEYFDELR